MLKPQANASRELVSLDGVWNFALSQSVDIDDERAWKRTIPPKFQVPVPASYNDIFIDSNIRNHVGWVYYQRRFTIPLNWSQQRYFLRFDAATHRGRVYVDDQFIAEHIGGYTPFEVDISDIVQPGKAVSNELDWHTIPPGRIETLKNGKRKQHYQHDFFNYAGLARSVWLFSVPIMSVKDIKVVTKVEGTTGIVDFDIATSIPLDHHSIKVTLLDEDECPVSHASELSGSLVVESVHLWQPGAAYLYHLQAEISLGTRPFYFTGFGKHEDTPIRGKGHDPAYMIHDFQLMNWMGANSFRTSHYPYAEEVLEYADRHGIVVINETAAVGLNLTIVAGLFGQKPIPTFSPDTMNDETSAAHAQAIRELIARDKNHPSVVMWTVANEPAASEPGVREYMEPLVKLNRELDPTRPICFANENQANIHTDLIADLFDVICLNRYYGWYLNTGDLEEAEQEYGADTMAGLHTVGDIPWSEEYQSRVLEMSHRVFDRMGSVVGEQVWNFADFQTPSSFIFRVDGNKKGVFTRDRRPKSAVQVLKKRWTEMKAKT
ncbi:beta-glucuronidase [Fusarium pseudocircinatum]|uniref:Beta-glucuronidase n=1 Tax=Fusarium pseudocircinatum TaxID=56676 RepID=A0A8H5UJJ8_9HYPO|nr:beta-glucuronidase [Fusarium pseudocircinatum]